MGTAVTRAPAHPAVDASQRAMANLSSKVVRGGVLKLAGAAPVNLLHLAIAVLSVRLLAPEAYGTYGLAMAIYGFADIFSNPAVLRYLIRETEASDLAIDVAWTVSVARGLLMSVALWLLAPVLALAFDGDATLTRMLRILSGSFALFGLRNLHAVRDYHQLRYGKMVALESVGSVLGLSVSVGLLVWTRNPVVLVLGVVGGYAVDVVVWWLLAPRPPHWAFQRGEFGQQWRFTRHLLASNIIIFALLNLDDLAVAHLAGLAAVGQYALSYRLVSAAILVVLRPIRDALFPAIARLRNEPGAFADATFRALQSISTLTWLLATVAWVFTPEIFAAIDGGPQWERAQPIFRALFPFALIRGLNGNLGNILIVAGRPQDVTRAAGLQLLLMLPAMYFGFEAGGTTGIALGLGILCGLTHVVHLVQLSKATELNLWRLTLSVLLPGLPVVPVILLRHQIPALPIAPIWTLCVGSAAAAIIFVGLWELLALPFRGQPRAIVRSVLGPVLSATRPGKKGEKS